MTPSEKVRNLTLSCVLTLWSLLGLCLSQNCLTLKSSVVTTFRRKETHDPLNLQTFLPELRSLSQQCRVAAQVFNLRASDRQDRSSCSDDSTIRLLLLQLWFCALQSRLVGFMTAVAKSTQSPNRTHSPNIFLTSEEADSSCI